jgi:abhydrolase domain-containing protein 12
VIIAHAENDLEIPASHSDVLFQAFLEPHLPETKPLTLGQMLSPEEWEDIQEVLQQRNSVRRGLVQSTTIPRFGRVDEFSADGRSVVLVKTLVGSHDFIGIQEGLQDIIKRKFRL